MKRLLSSIFAGLFSLVSVCSCSANIRNQGETDSWLKGLGLAK